MPGFDNGVMFADNVDFSGSSVSSGTASVTQDGQLLIGSSSAPHIRVGTIAAGSTKTSVTNGSGTIAIDVVPSQIDINALGGTPLTVSGGGTGVATLTSRGVVIGQGTGAVQTTAAGTAGQVLQSGGAGANPAYSTSTYPSTSAQGDILYASAANTITTLAKNTSSTRYLSNTGASNNPAWAQVDVSNGITGTVPVANGGLNSTGITGIVAGTGSAYNGRTITGTSNQIAVTNGNGSAGNPTLAFASTATFTSTQPSMLAYKSADTTNATGDGTNYTVIFDVETYDQGGNYNPVTGIFTCPVTGNYLITGNVGFSNFGTSTFFTTFVQASPLYQTYNSSQGVANTGILGYIWCPFSSILRLTAGTSIAIFAQGTGGTKNNTIIGGSAYATWLSIVLVN